MKSIVTSQVAINTILTAKFDKTFQRFTVSDRSLKLHIGSKFHISRL